jgi:type II secretion system protein D
MKKPRLNLIAILLILPLVPTGFNLRAQQPPAVPPSQAPLSQQSPSQPVMTDLPKGDEPVTIKFPHASVVDILSFYEQLTGKKFIRDSNLQGPELSIEAPGAITKKDAVSLIESSLLLNGYTLVPVDSATVKILGPSRPPRSEGLPLYVEESQLPAEGDKIVSFYKPLKFLSPSEAITILQGVVQLNAYGSLVAVPNTAAIVITDKTPVIRKALALLDVVDQAPSQIITEFIPLQRASADKVVETLGAMFGSGGGASPSAPPTGGQPPQGGGQGGAAVVSSGSDTHLLSGKAQFIADKRTNRILVIVRADNYKYVREVINKLDQPVDLSQPLIRPLNFISETDLFPVLVDMLKGKEEVGKEGSSGSNSLTTRQPTTQSNNASSSLGSSSSSGGVANSPDRLQEAAAMNPPQSVTIGATSIIGDSSGNAIIVYGPQDAKTKASQIIDLLDQRPKQVYLAAVIGSLELNDGLDYGANWFAKIGTSGTNNLYAAALTPDLNNMITGTVNGITNAATALNGIAGLNIFGYVAKNVLTYAHFLETTGKFRILSRPCVYTSNNKKATIFSGQNVPVPTTGSYTPVSSGNTTTNIANQYTTAIGYQPVVLKLEVIPLINSDKEVNLVIAQKNDTIGSTNNIGGNQVPVINTQELTTTVRVPNGSTIVLGGLISEEKTSADDGVPYLNRIPVLGPLLGGHNAKNKIRRELVVMIQPIVVDSNQKMEEASALEGGSSELGIKGANLREKLRPTPTPTPKKQWYQKIMQPRKMDNF